MVTYMLITQYVGKGLSFQRLLTYLSTGLGGLLTDEKLAGGRKMARRGKKG